MAPCALLLLLLLIDYSAAIVRFSRCQLAIFAVIFASLIIFIFTRFAMLLLLRHDALLAIQHAATLCAPPL